MLGKTPEFLRWALAHACALKDFPKWTDPNRTERHLRAIRVYQNAVNQDRILNGVAVEPIQDASVDVAEVLGFRVHDVFEFYGDPEAVSKTCEVCPANAMKMLDSSAWVGCFGMMPVNEVALPDLVGELPNGSVDMRELLQQVLKEDSELVERIYEAFDKTSPSWYGLWISRTPSLKQRAIQLEVVEAVLQRTPCTVSAAWDAFHRGLRLSVEQNIPLHVQLVPEAETDGVYWFVDSHCGRCGAIASSEKHTGTQCLVCKNEGRPRQPQRRFVRGKRPYWKMTRFLGEDGAREFLNEYKQHKGWDHVTVR
tara:strand:- start:1983 stop:2912 length:930 start_codon:yes stop_codon:yes gene_type:complete